MQICGTPTDTSSFIPRPTQAQSSASILTVWIPAELRSANPRACAPAVTIFLSRRPSQLSEPYKASVYGIPKWACPVLRSFK
jgi:hypothetical protein